MGQVCTRRLSGDTLGRMDEVPRFISLEEFEEEDAELARV
jgi:hypothetical protein